MTNILSLRRGMLATLVVATATIALIIASPVHAEETDIEDTSSINFTGQLIELSSTSVPTTVVVRENPAGEFTDYTVDITEDTKLGEFRHNSISMNDWVPGDSLKIKGELNENTGVVTARRAINRSTKKFHGLNGWITTIDENAGTMTVQWNNIEHVVNVTDRTRMVVPPTNPAALSDFEIEDRVRIRLFDNGTVENEARIILALRRGPEIYNLARTRPFSAELNEIDSDSNTMNVTLLENKHLADADVNNLVGVEGDQITIEWNDYTKFVRKYRGDTDEDELSSGDHLYIVGRVDDDGTVLARLVKDNSIFRKDVTHRKARIINVDTDANKLEVEGLKNEGMWTIDYTDETELLYKDESVQDNFFETDQIVRVRGTANTASRTVDAEKVSIHDAKKIKLRKHEARLKKQHEDVKRYKEKLREKRKKLLEKLKEVNKKLDEVNGTVSDNTNELTDRSDDTENIEDVEDVENIEDSEIIEDVEDTEDTENENQN